MEHNESVLEIESEIYLMQYGCYQPFSISLFFSIVSNMQPILFSYLQRTT